jgi:iron(III) transport system permease protein
MSFLKIDQIFSRLFLILIMGILIIPLFFIMLKMLEAQNINWSILKDARIWSLLVNSFKLSFTVGIASNIIGMILAFIYYYFDFPYKRVTRLLLLIPFSFPSYISAICYVILTSKNNLLDFISIYNFWGISLVLTLLLFPLSFIFITTGLRKLDSNFIESAQLLGFKNSKILYKVVFPLIFPHFLGAFFLIALYVFADFGAVAILRYKTFTTAIFYQLESYNMESAFVLSFLLLVICWVILSIKEFFIKEDKYKQKNMKRKLVLGRLKVKYLIILYTFISILILFSLILPFYSLISMAKNLPDISSIILEQQGSMYWSLLLALIVCVVTTVISVSVVSVRYISKSKIYKMISKTSLLIYTFPGILLAIGWLYTFQNILTFFYGSFLGLVLAYSCKFIPYSLEQVENCYIMISSNIIDSSKIIGKKYSYYLQKILIPLLKPGISSGILLVFIASLKELPIALILRPLGVDTLSVRVWLEASDGFYAEAAPLCLIILFISIIPIPLIEKRFQND